MHSHMDQFRSAELLDLTSEGGLHASADGLGPGAKQVQIGNATFHNPLNVLTASQPDYHSIPGLRPFAQTIDPMPHSNFRDRRNMRSLGGKSPFRRFANFNSQSVNVSAASLKNHAYLDQRIPSQSMRKNLLINATKHLSMGPREGLSPSAYASHPGIRVKQKRVKNLSHDFRTMPKPTGLGPLARHYRVEEHRSRPPQQLMKVASSMHRRKELFVRQASETAKPTYDSRFSPGRSCISIVSNKKLSTHVKPFSRA